MQVKILKNFEKSPAIASIQRSFVQNSGVFDIESGVAHDCHHGVLSGRKLFKVDDLDGPRLDHRPMWVHQVVEQRIDAIPLV